MKDNLIANKTFDFSLTIIDLFIQLKKENEFIISKQIMRSGTSIGANVEEAIAAQSKKDFINEQPRSRAIGVSSYTKSKLN